MPGFSRVLSFAASIPTGRFTRFPVIAIWIVVLATLGHNSVNLTKAQKSDPADTLPSKAESVRALRESARFPAGRLTTAAVVYRRASGLTASDLNRIKADALALRSVQGVGSVASTEYSHDRTSGLVLVGVNAARGGVITSVKAIRRHLGHGGGGLVIQVTGPAAFIADAASVFSGVDATLLFATLGLVFVLLIAIYRSPIFWVFPLFSIIVAVGASRGLAYILGKHGVTITGEDGGILTVLVFGVGTDYSLLLVARYREELEREENARRAMALALQRAAPAIVPSSLTVTAGLLCLLLARVKGTEGLGAIGAVGVAAAMLSVLTLLPALLALAGRRAFWPLVPHAAANGEEIPEGTWKRVALRVAAAPRRIWPASLLFLAVLAIGLIDLNSSLTSENGFISTPDAVKGQRLVAKAFPPGVSAPAYVVTTDVSRIDAVYSTLKQDPLLASVGPLQQSHGAARFEASLAHDPYGAVGFRDIQSIRKVARAQGGTAMLVGGPTAQDQDLRSAQSRDNLVIIPIVLALVFVILAALLRAVIASLLLIGTVIASFAAVLGLASVAFDVVFQFAGMDPSLPLLGFIFLVALGIDYNIFLMSRVHSEAAQVGTREGMIRGLSATGGVITSAGVVLAGTFCMLAVLPLAVLTEIGLLIAVGVLLDTFLVRSLLVPALVLDIGPRVWWPSALRLDRRSALRSAHS